MPTYGYECKNCGFNFDVFQSIKDEPLKVCPECGKEIRRLINGGTGVIFKGGGFYSTDKGGKTGGSAKPKDAKSSGTEKAPCTACSNSETCPKAANS